jgi:hypothetical protein
MKRFVARLLGMILGLIVAVWIINYGKSTARNGKSTASPAAQEGR